MNSKQRGASFLSWIVIAAMVSALGLMAARLGPAYADYYTIISLIQALPSDKVHTMSSAEIKDSLGKRFLINNIRDLNVNQIISIEQRRETTTLHLKYEVREPLIYNVWIVAAFDRQFDYT